MKSWLLLLIWFALAPALALGQQGPNPALDLYEWKELPDSGQLSLRKNGEQIGVWIPDKGYFARLGPQRFAELPSEPPIPPPTRPELPPAKPNFGIVEDKISSRPAYRINGRPAARSEVYSALTGGLTDDSGLWRLTLIGTKSDCDRVAADLANHPTLAPYRGKLVVRSFAPDHWAIKEAGFKTGGTPTIYCQTPDGIVLHRQDDYVSGPEALAEALRKADPSYDPNKDPDKRKNDPRIEPAPSFHLPPLALVLAGMVISLVLFGLLRKK